MAFIPSVQFQVVVINVFINIARSDDIIKNDCTPVQQKYVVSIRKGSTHICGGSLLRPDWVLTAAQCEDSDLFVVAGLSGGSKAEVKVYVKEFYSHPDYSSPPLNDIALIFLARPIKRTDYISYARLPNKSVSEVCSEAIAIGWGKLWSGEATLYPKNIQCFPVSILPHEKCEHRLRWFQYDTLMCSLTSDETKTCIDDYGGPVICNDVQVGVVAWQIECGNPFIPGLYTRVNKHLKFIDDIMNGSLSIIGSSHKLIIIIIITLYFVEII